MSRFLFRRVLRALLLVFIVSSAALLLVHLAPGDAFSGIGRDQSNARSERSRLGLDRPFVEQYANWLSRSARLDFGESTRFSRPVTGLLAERLPRTLMLGTAALCVAIALGFPLGVLAGAFPERWWSRTIRAASMVLLATPPLVTSLVLLLLAARTGWLPAGGLVVATNAPIGERVSLTLVALVLPTLALALPIAASIERLQAHAVSDALKEPCVRAAVARGISGRRVLWNHALRLSLKPVLAILGIIVGTVLSGSLVVEIVMNWPGIGELMYQALLSRDLFLAAGCAAAAAVCLSFGVLLSDISLAALDPRVREAE